MSEKILCRQKWVQQPTVCMKSVPQNCQTTPQDIMQFYKMCYGMFIISMKSFFPRNYYILGNILSAAGMAKKYSISISRNCMTNSQHTAACSWEMLVYNNFYNHPEEIFCKDTASTERIQLLLPQLQVLQNSWGQYH